MMMIIMTMAMMMMMMMIFKTVASIFLSSEFTGTSQHFSNHMKIDNSSHFIFKEMGDDLWWCKFLHRIGAYETIIILTT
jgi:hypothetical protein